MAFHPLSLERSLRNSAAKNARLKEAREHDARLRQLAEQTRAEADERLTQELIDQHRRLIDSLEEATAFWLKIFQNSLQATSRSGFQADVSPRSGRGSTSSPQE